MVDTTTDFISKEYLLQSISKMPDQISLDALMDEIIFLYKVEIAMKKSKKGEGITIEAFREKVRTTWTKSK